MAGDFWILATAFGLTTAVFVALWGVSLALRDSSIVDFWWGPGFLVQCGVAAWAVRDGLGPQALAILGLVALWSIRLGLVLGRRRLREGHEDPRYTTLREAWDPGFWWKSLGIVFVVQAVLQWLMALGPMIGILSGTGPLGVAGLVGLAIALIGFSLETTADAQLDAFKARGGGHGLCDTGLRAYVRHPNYLGEILFWIGVACVAVEAGAWIAMLSPVLIALLLTRLSGAPILDERLGMTRPGYAAYCARVPAFVPRLRGQRARA